MNRNSYPAPCFLRLPSRMLWVLVSAIALTGCARIIATYFVFNQAYDEPYHVAAGMEWLDKGVYLYERQHPPLSRIAVALPLYLRGLRAHSIKNPIEEGNVILQTGGEYADNLALARFGNLPFFLLSVLLLALWANRLFGPCTALTSVALFTLLPPILGHAALATTDMAAVAGLLAALYAFSHWLQEPSIRQSAIFGAALGFAFLTKFSVIPFLAVGGFLTVAWILLHQSFRVQWNATACSRQATNLLVVMLTAAIVVWSLYRFTLAPVVTGHGYRPSTTALGPLSPIAERLLDAKLPLGEFLGGIGSVAIHNRAGHESFLLGAFRTTGWWYYFPVVLAVKTPLAFLVLALLGIPLAVRRLRSAEWQQGLPLLFAAGILTSCVAARINIGVRHILPIYPLLSLIAADAIVTFSGIRLQERDQALAAGGGYLSLRPLSFGILAVVATLAVESALAHPDYMAWFNVLAGSHPERVLVNSDIDSGQDLSRLVARLKTLRVGSLKIAYFGSTDITQIGLPPFEQLEPQERATGWIACSAFNLMLRCAKDGSYCWLRDEVPVERVGRSIFLYFVPGPQSAAASPQ